FQPGGSIAGLAAGTMTVAARVVERYFGGAGRAVVNVAAQVRRAAGRQRGQHFALLHAYVCPACFEELAAVAPDDFADFERRGRESCGVSPGTWRSSSRGSRSSDWQAACR